MYYHQPRAAGFRVMSAEPEVTRMGQQAFRCTVPDRKRSALMSLMGIAAASAFLTSSLFVPSAGWKLYFLYACFLLCSAFGLLFMLATAMPGKFMMGVALAEDGFEFRAPLRARKFIPFREIQRIEALSRGDGDRGDEVPWRIYSRGGKVLVTEEMLFASGLPDILESRLSLDPTALSAAHKHEPHGLDLLIGKGFTIYQNKQA